MKWFHEMVRRYGAVAVALALFGFGMTVHAEGTDASTIITDLQTKIVNVLGLVLTAVAAVIGAASSIWLLVLAYKRARSSTKSAAS